MGFLTSHYAHLVARDTQNRGYISEDLNIVIITVTFLLYGMRMYSRLFISKSPGLDDAIITVGVVSGISKTKREIMCIEPSQMFATTLSVLEIKCEFEPLQITSKELMFTQGVEYGAGRQLAEVAQNNPEDLANFFHVGHFYHRNVCKTNKM
jgi:hypothetical protein